MHKNFIIKKMLGHNNTTKNTNASVKIEFVQPNGTKVGENLIPKNVKLSDWDGFKPYINQNLEYKGKKLDIYKTISELKLPNKAKIVCTPKQIQNIQSEENPVESKEDFIEIVPEKAEEALQHQKQLSAKPLANSVTNYNQKGDETIPAATGCLKTKHKIIIAISSVLLAVIIFLIVFFVVLKKGKKEEIPVPGFEEFVVNLKKNPGVIQYFRNIDHKDTIFELGHENIARVTNSSDIVSDYVLAFTEEFIENSTDVKVYSKRYYEGYMVLLNKTIKTDGIEEEKSSDGINVLDNPDFMTLAKECMDPEMRNYFDPDNEEIDYDSIEKLKRQEDPENFNFTLNDTDKESMLLRCLDRPIIKFYCYESGELINITKPVNVSSESMIQMRELLQEFLPLLHKDNYYNSVPKKTYDDFYPIINSTDDENLLNGKFSRVRRTEKGKYILRKLGLIDEEYYSIGKESKEENITYIHRTNYNPVRPENMDSSELTGSLLSSETVVVVNETTGEIIRISKTGESKMVSNFSLDDESDQEETEAEEDEWSKKIRNSNRIDTNINGIILKSNSSIVIMDRFENNSLISDIKDFFSKLKTKIDDDNIITKMKNRILSAFHGKEAKGLNLTNHHKFKNLKEAKKGLRKLLLLYSPDKDLAFNFDIVNINAIGIKFKVAIECLLNIYYGQFKIGFFIELQNKRILDFSIPFPKILTKLIKTHKK